MKKISVFLFLIIILFSLHFTSCNNQTKKKHLSQLDSLLLVLDDTKKGFELANTDSIIFIYENVQTTIVVFKQKFSNTSPDSTFLKDFSKYSLLKSQLKKLSKNINHMHSELEFTEKQLKNLIKDVEKNSFENEELEKYLNDEIAAVNQLSLLLKPTLNSSAECLNLYNKLQTKMEKYSTELIPE